MTRDPQPKTRCLIVPSCSGRNRFYSDKFSLRDLGRRPLIVGSEPEFMRINSRLVGESPSPHGRVGTMASFGWKRRKIGGRRPLMVGSEPNTTRLVVTQVSASPSPHGRVGTKEELEEWWKQVAVAVPSWSGRNLAQECRRLVYQIESPSPHGRVGTKANFGVLATK